MEPSEKISILDKLINPVKRGMEAKRAQVEADENLKQAMLGKREQVGYSQMSPMENINIDRDLMDALVMAQAQAPKAPNLRYLKLNPGVQFKTFLGSTEKMDPEDYGVVIKYVRAVDDNPRAELGELGKRANVIANAIGIDPNAGVKSVRNAFNALLDYASQNKNQALMQAENMGTPTGMPSNPVMNKPPFDIPYLGRGR